MQSIPAVLGGAFALLTATSAMAQTWQDEAVCRQWATQYANWFQSQASNNAKGRGAFGGALLGAGIGAIAGGGRGAAIGAGAGAFTIRADFRQSRPARRFAVLDPNQRAASCESSAVSSSTTSNPSRDTARSVSTVEGIASVVI